MNWMKHHFFIYALIVVFSCMSIAADEIDLEQVYRQLDKAIMQTDQFVQERENRILQTRIALEATHDSEAQYELCRRLYDEYQSYINDSAIYYIDRCIAIAEQMGDRIHAEESQLQLAYQCT